jgi:DNA ligase 1
MNYKPQKAPREVPQNHPGYFEKLKYPLLGSPKYDGIRGVVPQTILMSSTLKPIPSLQAQDLFCDFRYNDGELVEGCPTDFGVYNRTQSHIMSESREGDVNFYVFDNFRYPDKPFYKRLEYRSVGDHLIHVEFEEINNHYELLDYEAEILERGYEGVMLNNPLSAYKYGRATFLQNIIFKLKRFVDDEAVVVGFEEELTNNNVKTTNALGLTERSHHAENKVGADTTGKFLVEYQNDILAISPGCFNHAERKHIWDNRHKFVGHLLKFRYFLHGSKNKPRQPYALGWRSPEDL